MGRLVPQSGTALDIGCGTGTLSLLLSERGLSVTGIDTSLRMIEFARRKATAAGAGINFQVDDAGSPTLPPAQFDLVLGRHILWALPDLSATLNRWSTLLRPGGRMVLIEGFLHTGAGLHLQQVENALPETMTRILSENLGADAGLWGGPVADERYVVVARVTTERWRSSSGGFCIYVPNGNVGVRRQIIWRSLGLGLAEYRPRLWVDVMRRACGAASADAGWFVV